MMQNLFTYGTLMCGEIMEAVCGCELAGVAARLDGHARRAILAEAYPAMVAKAGECVSGVLYQGLPARIWPLLDRYEGNEYYRERVEVQVGNGATRPAWAYLFRDEFRARIGDEPWSFPEFLSRDKPAYMRTLKMQQR